MCAYADPYARQRDAVSGVLDKMRAVQHEFEALAYGTPNPDRDSLRNVLEALQGVADEMGAVVGTDAQDPGGG